MRSHLAAATLILAVGLGPSFAQSPSPDTPAANSPAAKSDANKSDPAKGGLRKAAKGDTNAKAATAPPAAGGDPLLVPGGRNVTATGKTMPPASGRGGAAPLKSSTEVEMLKAQKAAEERNKAWDAKMRRTMSTICNGC